jgi:hypothetical protein
VITRHEQSNLSKVTTRSARAVSRKQFEDKADHFSIKWKRASEGGARKGFQPQIMLIITWKIFSCKLRRRSRTIAKYAPTLTVSGKIAREEFCQYCILYFFQYSGHFPVILTEGCNVSSRRRSRFFSRGRDKRRLRKRRPGGFLTAETKVTLPLLFSSNNDAIGDPAAAGMLGHAFSQCHAWCIIILSRGVMSCCATPSCFIMMCHAFLLRHAFMLRHAVMLRHDVSALHAESCRRALSLCVACYLIPYHAGPCRHALS